METVPGRKKIGLALSGAVSRGTTHIGVLMALEQAGIPIDIITGTSAGAIVGALYAAGMSTDVMRNLLKKLHWWNLASLVWPTEGFISFKKMERWVANLLGDPTFDQLKMPFAAVTTDLSRGDPFMINEGKVAIAVHASCAVPGFIAPVHYEGRILCDGGISSNIPVAAARALGADYVIGVDLFAHTIRRKLGPLGYGFAAIEAMVRNSGDGRAHADYMITPELAGTRYLRMSNYAERIQLGLNTTVAALPEIRAALAGLAPGEPTPLLPEPTPAVEIDPTAFDNPQLAAR